MFWVFRNYRNMKYEYCKYVCTAIILFQSFTASDQMCEESTFRLLLHDSNRFMFAGVRTTDIHSQRPTQTLSCVCTKQ